MPEKKNIKTAEFEGIKFEYDADAIVSYKLTKAITNVEKDPVGYFDAMSIIFCGKDDEYAEKLGGSAAKLVQLYEACVRDSATAKN